MSLKLYVGNLSFQTSSEDLQQLFAQAGTVESATVVEDRGGNGGRPGGNRFGGGNRGDYGHSSRH